MNRQPLYQFLLATLFLFFLGNSTASHQNKNIWQTLALLAFESPEAMSGQKESKIIPLIEALEGMEVEVKGYVIPLSGKKAQSHFMFSAYPYANCFFCGNAGPETVMEVFVKGNKKVDYSDESIILKGTFHFTSRDPEDVMFTLENAELVN